MGPTTLRSTDYFWIPYGPTTDGGTGAGVPWGGFWFPCPPPGPKKPDPPDPRARPFREEAFRRMRRALRGAGR